MHNIELMRLKVFPVPETGFTLMARFIKRYKVQFNPALQNV